MRPVGIFLIVELLKTRASPSGPQNNFPSLNSFTSSAFIISKHPANSVSLTLHLTHNTFICSEIVIITHPFFTYYKCVLLTK